MGINKENLMIWFRHNGYDNKKEVSDAVDRAIKTDDPFEAIDELINKNWDENELQELLPEWIEYWKEEKESASLTWVDLAKEIDKMTLQQKNKTVRVSNQGSETFGHRIKYDKFGDPLIEGF